MSRAPVCMAHKTNVDEISGGKPCSKDDILTHSEHVNGVSDAAGVILTLMRSDKTPSRSLLLSSKPLRSEVYHLLHYCDDISSMLARAG